ncbi:uncharacterized protein V6R79_022516 [Siganus canaliculatus]
MDGPGSWQRSSPAASINSKQLLSLKPPFVFCLDLDLDHRGLHVGPTEASSPICSGPLAALKQTVQEQSWPRICWTGSELAQDPLDRLRAAPTGRDLWPDLFLWETSTQEFPGSPPHGTWRQLSSRSLTRTSESLERQDQDQFQASSVLVPD